MKPSLRAGRGTSGGGCGAPVKGLFGSLPGQGHTVVVACPPEVEEHFHFARVATTTASLEVADRPHPTRDARAVRDLARLSAKADVVHAHGLRAAALAVIATARSGVPVVATLHNAAPSGALTSPAYAGLERVVARGSDLVLGVSADLVERMRRLGARRTGLAVIAAPPRREAERDRYAVRSELGIGGRTSLGVVVARLAPQKLSLIHISEPTRPD